MKNMSQNKFNITLFDSFRSVPNQYTDAFIKSSGAVKISENNEIVTAAVRTSCIDTCKEILSSYHCNKKLIIINTTDSDFSEFVGRYLEKPDALRDNTSIDNKSFNLDDVSNSTIINIINSFFLEATRLNASDIHIEPCNNNMRIRFRLDGVLKTIRILPMSLYSGIISRLKIMANLNIMENRLPQDGHIQATFNNKTLDVRFSSVPVKHGESIVLRLFNNTTTVPQLHELGFSSESFTKISKASNYPNGLILLTGPTGSGKTTTLHAMLGSLDSDKLKIITIEDPVERELPGINQIQVHEEIGLTFENLLRRVLRQDPNVIMIGEIRDTETAQLALRAALTGHLIFATLHTNDSVSAVSRLENMGLEPYLLSSILRISVAQRLVRKVCPFCSEKTEIPKNIIALKKQYSLKGDHILIEHGCDKCNYTGFIGRTVISEVFIANKDSEAIISNGSIPCLDEKDTLSCDGIRKVLNGETTLSELKREGILL